MHVKKLEMEFQQSQKANSDKVKKDFLKLSISVRKTVDKVLKLNIEPLQKNSNGGKKHA